MAPGYRSLVAVPFLSLDFIYMPSRDVASDVRFFTDVLGAERVFAIDGMGARVAMVKLTDEPPRLLLADHVEGEVPILVFRVESLATALDDLKSHAWEQGTSLELPMGPAHSFTAPGGQRIAIYESTRSDVIEHFAGRADF